MWLLWTGNAPADVENALAALTQRVVEVRELSYLSYCFDPAEDIPGDRAAAHPLVGRSITPASSAPPWAALPSADFTTFLAACRRHLPGHAFTLVAGKFYADATRADSWMLTHRHLVGSGHAFTAHLAALLRDHILGPADDAMHTLIRLRAVQAALFLQGVLLRWDPAILGAEPARRLPGTLTGPIAHRLSTMCRTELGAATALSLHLNHGPTYFEAAGWGQLVTRLEHKPPAG